MRFLAWVSIFSLFFSKFSFRVLTPIVVVAQLCLLSRGLQYPRHSLESLGSSTIQRLKRGHHTHRVKRGVVPKLNKVYKLKPLARVVTCKASQRSLQIADKHLDFIIIYWVICCAIFECCSLHPKEFLPKGAEKQRVSIRNDRFGKIIKPTNLYKETRVTKTRPTNIQACVANTFSTIWHCRNRNRLYGKKISLQTARGMVVPILKVISKLSPSPVSLENL